VAPIHFQLPIGGPVLSLHVSAPPSAADFVDLGRCWLVFASEHVNADVYQELFRQHLIPWIQKTYPGEKYVFPLI
jgi:hypothetical protein